jgi:hypothetical protein
MRFTATPLKSQTSRGSRTDPGAALSLELLSSLPAIAGEMIGLAATCRCMNPVVAHLSHANGHWERLFIGAHRKSSARSQNGAFDPLLTSPDKNILSQSEWFAALAMGGHNV